MDRGQASEGWGGPRASLFARAGVGEVEATTTVITTSAQVVERARSCIGHGTYKLGRGGFDPTSQWPWATSVEMCDCSGFVSWCIGEKRDQRELKGIGGDGWIETTNMVADALGLARMFHLVQVAIPGDIVVYGDEKILQSPHHYFLRQGHTGIVSQVDASGHPFKVIHCSKGNFDAMNHAIAETAPNVFVRNHAIVVRPNKLYEVQ